MQNSKMKILLPIIGVILLVFILALYFIFNSYIPENNSQITNEIQNNNQKNTIGIPLHVSIPIINVEAEITPAGLAEDGSIAVPDGPNGVTWYQYGPKPGEMGSAVITGHYGPWQSGVNSVFDNLNNLKNGDKVYIKDNEGKTLTFQVKDKKVYKLDEIVPEIFIKDDASYLNLITCSGEWLANQKTFTNRLVVFTELVE